MRRIEVTPGEASQKICPVMSGRYHLPVPIGSVPENSMVFSCVGDRCMLWCKATPTIEKGVLDGPGGKKLDRVTETGKGYCGA